MSAGQPGAAFSPLSVHAGELFAGRYQVLAQVGSGSTSAVYKVKDTLAEEIIAIKLVLPDAAGNPKILSNFKRELSVARRLSHPNLLRIFDLGQHKGLLYIVMEYMEGRTLSALLAEKGPYPVPVMARVLDQVCAALTAIHSNGIIHRDIKPQNIMYDRAGTLKVMDFGIAREMAGRQTLGALVGTPAYMPPEQILGKPLSATADIYSAGAMFFELLTGKRPLSERTFAGRCSSPPPKVRDYNPSVPAELARIIERCMEPEPKDRFQTAADLAQAATTVLTAPPAPAGPGASATQSTRLPDLRVEQPAAPNPAVPLFLKILAYAGVLLGILVIAGLVLAAWKFRPQLLDMLQGSTATSRPKDPRASAAPAPTASRGPAPERT